MGSIKPFEKSTYGGRPPGKIEASLNKKLSEVEWGEYRLGELFESANGNFDIQKIHINGKGEYVVTAGLTDNGILGKTDVDAKVFNEQTITVDMFGFAFYRAFKYKMVTHARVFSLTPLFKINDKIGLFIASSISFLHFEFGYENMCSWEKIKNKKIQLPTKNGKIDFDFIESFIAELEAERVTELATYLKVNGFDNYELSGQEIKALERLNIISWGKYRIGDLFDKIKTQKLPYKAKKLPTSPTGEYVLPCLTSSFQNQGLNYYVPKDGATILKDVITIPQNSDVYRAYYQSNEFTVLSDAYAIDWIYDDSKLTKTQYLFMVMCINKVTDLPIYSYKNKLGGWNVVKDKYILLPKSNGNIDLDFMNNFISAIIKLSIKDVVQYSKAKIQATKAVTADTTK